MENASGIVNAILGGWQTSGLLVFSSDSLSRWLMAFPFLVEKQGQTLGGSFRSGHKLPRDENSAKLVQPSSFSEGSRSK